MWLAVCVVLAACSGGSGGSGESESEPEPEPALTEREKAPSFQEQAPELLRDDAQPLERPLSGAGAGAEAVTTDRPEALAVSLSGNALVLTPKPLDRPVTATVALLDEAGRRLTQFRVNLVNAAGEPARRRARGWLEARGAVTRLAEGCALARVVAGAAYLDQALAFPAYSTLTAGWALPFEGEAPALDKAYEALEDAQADYRQGAINAGALAAAVDAVREQARRHQSEHSAPVVAEAYAAMPEWQAPPEQGLRYHEPTGRVSSLVGNTALGEWTGDRWRFDTPWRHLTAVPVDGGVPECQ